MMMIDHLCVKIVAGAQCRTPANHHAPHDAADWYCDEHQSCSYCGGSVDKFRFYEPSNRWLCPCVIRKANSPIRRRVVEVEQPVEQEKKILEIWNQKIG